MADALIGIGIDLSQLARDAGKIPQLVGKDAEQAVRQVQRAAIKASKDIERVQRAATKAAAAEARQAARATTQAARILEKAEQAQMTAAQKAQRELTKELALLDRLQKEGADATTTAKARAAAVVAGAKRIGAARQSELGAVSVPPVSQLNGYTEAMTGAAGATSQMGRAAQSVAMQLPDVFGQIAAGTSPARALATQGMQVLQVNMGLVITAGRALAGVLMGPLGIALAAATAAGALYYASLKEQEAEQVNLTAAINSTARAMDPKLVRLYTQAQRDMAASVADATLLLHQETGALDSLEVSQMKAVEATREQARAAILAARAQYVRLEVQRQTLQQAILSGDLNFEQTAAAQKRLDLLKREVPAALEKARALEEEAEAQAAQVNETYNAIAAERARKEAEKAAEKAAEQARRARTARTRATRQGTEEDKAQREEMQRARKALAVYTRALEAAQKPFVDRSEIAQLRRLQAGLVAAAGAADLSTEQTAKMSDALSALAQRINEIETAPMLELQREIDETIKWANEMEGSLSSAAEAIPVGRIIASGIVDQFSAGLDTATSMLSTFTGGATSQLNTLSGTLQLIAEGPEAARQMAKSAVAFIDAVADNIGAVIRVLTANIDDVAVALAKAMPKVVYAIVRQAPAIAVAIVEALIKAVPVLLRTIARQIRRTVEHLFRGGRNSGDRRRNRRRVSDTPGPIRVTRESAVVAAPGDYVAAARTRQGLEAQIGARSAPTEVVTVIDVRDGPVRLGMSVAASRAVRRSGVGRDTSGRRRVY